MTSRVGSSPAPSLTSREGGPLREKPEAFLSLFLAGPNESKALPLRVAVGDADTPPADLHPVQDQVVGAGPDRQRVGGQERPGGLQRRGKWVVHRDQAALLFAPLQH